MKTQVDNTLPKGHVITEEVALKEVAEFIEYYTRLELSDAEIKEQYPRTVAAACMGLLLIGEDKTPTYLLEVPITAESGSVVLDKITFRTRITMNDRKRFMSGLNIEKDSIEIGLRMSGFLIGQPVAYFDKFDRWDLKVIQEILPLFH